MDMAVCYGPMTCPYVSAGCGQFVGECRKDPGSNLCQFVTPSNIDTTYQTRPVCFQYSVIPNLGRREDGIGELSEGGQERMWQGSTGHGQQ